MAYLQDSKYGTHKFWKEWDNKGRLRSAFSACGFQMSVFYKGDLVGHIQTQVIKPEYINKIEINKDVFSQADKFNSFIIETHSYGEDA